MNAGSRTAGGSLRYETILKLASGGMATVYVGTVRGALGFRQIVAIKKPHPHLLDDEMFRKELLAEARLASMIRHANVVDVRDVEVDGASISLVMDYIEGASLGELLLAASRGGPKMDPSIAIRIVLDACAGLHAAHELSDEKGRLLGLVHRDISPQNILVGTDGVSRVADFGVAKCARSNMPSTSGGVLKGKLAYMAPEYLRGAEIDRRFDVFAMGVVLWEALSGKRLFRGEHEVDTMQRVLNHQVQPISELVPALGTTLDAVIACATQKERDHRFNNAAAMAAALESSARGPGLIATTSEVASLVARSVGEDLEARRSQVRARLSATGAMSAVLSEPATTEPDPAPPPDPTTRGVPPTFASPGMAANAAATLNDADKVPPTVIDALQVPSTLAGSAKIPSTLDDPLAPYAQQNGEASSVRAHGTLVSPAGTMPVAPPALTSEPDIGAMRTAFAPYDHRAEVTAPPRAIVRDVAPIAIAAAPESTRIPTSNTGMVALFGVLAIVAGGAVGALVILKPHGSATTTVSSASPSANTSSAPSSMSSIGSSVAVSSADPPIFPAPSASARSGSKAPPVATPRATPHPKSTATPPTPPTPATTPGGPPPNPYG